MALAAIPMTGRRSAALLGRIHSQPQAAYSIQFRTQDPSGAVRHMTETVVAASGIPGFIGTITDVTDLVAARDQLHYMAALHRNMFEQVPTGILVYLRHAPGAILSCNLGLSSRSARLLAHPRSKTNRSAC